MFLVYALLYVGVVCHVSLTRALMRVCVPYLSTQSEVEVMLQQVRDLLPPFRLSLVPLELKALSLVLASTPTVLAGSVLGSGRDSSSVLSAQVPFCVRIVHYSKDAAILGRMCLQGCSEKSSKTS